MRACFAILKDSFREAAASRVLWIALIGIVVVLLAFVAAGIFQRAEYEIKTV